MSERHLRRLFSDTLGAAPIAVQTTRRLLFAKQLLQESALSITDIAFAAGFGSVRRFNAAFLGAYQLAPSAIRRQTSVPLDAQTLGRAISGPENMSLRLGYRPPFDFPSMLAFLRTRALDGVEHVDAVSYARTLSFDGHPQLRARMRVQQSVSHPNTLHLQLQNVPPTLLLQTVQRVRRMFDLDADPNQIVRSLSADPQLAQIVARCPGLRLPSSWDGFEVAVRAILGQQISVAAARTLTQRLCARFGVASTPNLDPDAVLPWQTPCLQFPTPAALVDADLGGLGILEKRARCIQGIARALLDGVLSFQSGQNLREFCAAWEQQAGIGPWTANYIALRALGHPDAFPADDLILRRALASGSEALSARQLSQRAEAWRPWRGYAVLHLWRSMAPPEKSNAETLDSSQLKKSGTKNASEKTTRFNERS